MPHPEIPMTGTVSRPAFGGRVLHRLSVRDDALLGVRWVSDETIEEWATGTALTR
jgi:hypothetical protein